MIWKSLFPQDAPPEHRDCASGSCQGCVEFEALCEAESRRSLFNAQQDIPILGEYCWMHDGPGNGGWSCAECYHKDQRD